MKVNDLTVYYEESGEVKPLILLHGGGPALRESEIHKIIQEENSYYRTPRQCSNGTMMNGKVQRFISTVSLL